MGNIAIKGHLTRGKEVIEILEMLGAKNKYNLSGDGTNAYYVIELNEIKCGSVFFGDEPYVFFTVEEFLSKYPYKIGDFVRLSRSNISCIIRAMKWENNEIVYQLSCDDGWWSIDNLKPYNEETMESKPNVLQQLKEYFDNTPREVIEKEWHEYDKYNKIGPTVNEYLEYVNKSRQSEYPKTYVECCNVLEIKYVSYCIGYQEDLLDNFQQLIVCRDAYWKIAGWNPKVKSDVFYMNTLPSYLRDLFPMPTEEMRDTFFNNFKELFESCKAFL